MENKYSSLLIEKLDRSPEQQKKHLSNFNNAKNNLKGQSSSRAKRSVNTTPKLSKEERDSIWKMYSLHNNLKGAVEELILEFRDKATGVVDIPLALSMLNKNEVKKIEEALKKIEWSGDSIKTQKERNESKFYKAKSWGNWDVNPFQHFYTNEPEFAKDIQELQKNALKANRLQQEVMRTQGRYVDKHRMSGLYPKIKEQHEESIRRIAELSASSDSHIVQKVANSLLRSMGQI